MAAAADWEARAKALKPLNLKQIEGALSELDAHLTLRSYLEGYFLSDADTLIWKVLRANRVAHAYIKQNLMVNLSRWFFFIEQTAPQPTTELPSRNVKVNSADLPDGGNFDIGLPDTEKGVVTRFPPEPSGYLHIGHAKAALLNDFFAHKKYNGKMIVRFDDTNPSKEKEEYQDAILQDCELLGIKPDRVTYTSDYFEDLYVLAKRMISEGNAYADDTPQEQLREERMAKIESKRRNASPEESLKHFEEMKEGTEEGLKWFIRAKLDMTSDNGALRDPVIYRCNPMPHHRTGAKWKIYPTYDFACPAVDSVEGITHALRTTEYNDRDDQYQWFLKTLGLRHVHNWNFSRMNFIRTFLSKRKLTKVVDEGKVWGWDDPRMPTVRGIRRRGMTIPALQEFIVKQGPSKNITSMDWTTIWATNKKYIDPTAARYTAVVAAHKVKCTVIGAPDPPEIGEKELHSKFADVGTKKVTYSRNIIIDQEDAQSFDDNEEVTLMNWGNAIVRKKTFSLNPLNLVKASEAKTVSEIEFELHLEGDFKKTSKKITWLSTDQHLVPLVLFDFDYLIKKDKLEDDDVLENELTPNTVTETEALADSNVADLKEDAIIQFDRKGYFRIDRAYKDGQSVHAFQIPTGRGM